MTIKEAKEKLLFYIDSLFESGYNLGWNSVLEELEFHADELWNNGAKAEAEAIRAKLKDLRGIDG